MVDKNYDVPTGVSSPNKGPTPNRSAEKDQKLSPRVIGETANGLASATISDLPLKLPPKYLFTCTVGRTMVSQARYCLYGSQEIAFLLYHLCISSGIKPEGLSGPPPLPERGTDD